jgi:transcriptional regulator with XRE-family HTH domain
MTFRDALEREIAVQGISVAEVAQKSKVSKGTIYNILNRTTEDARIRAATRRAIARGCDRDLEVLPDGGVVFTESGQGKPGGSPEMLRLNLTPYRPFDSHSHVPEPFDWLHAQEESGRLKGLKTVDRVFQQREEFLELALSNLGDLDIVAVDFAVHVVFDNGVVGDVFCSVDAPIAPTHTLRQTVFLMGGPAYHLTFSKASYRDEDNQSWQISQVPNYRFEGDLA